MSFTLYASTGSGSVACEAVLALSGLDYTRQDVVLFADSGPDPVLISVNPLGQVPVLKLPNGDVMTESSAILLYLADLVPKAGLAPAVDSPLRPRYLRWMAFLASAVYPTSLNKFYPGRYTTDPDGGEAVRSAAVARLTREFAVLATNLNNGPFILGETMSAVDIYATMLMSWEENLEGFREVFPGLGVLIDHVTSHPVIRPIWQRNQLLA
nr:glutathione S-transferase family protein [uncultured Gellertiella sp.]